ncbi:MAG: hypothetical protein COW13_05470 [Candidatus Omnitrophica bacterium CG12_big_fil_rev_8_21_14_0_65_50_5]|nr:MAG: hypothetical protein COW13_05470 [Candidatus Omnitrophica bacterium CG12_big_fil_rev_8_21_14_0_65_50_5]
MNDQSLFPELKNIKPPVEVTVFPWLGIIITFLLVAAAVVLVVWILKKRATAPKKVLSACDEALAQLEKFCLESLQTSSEISSFYVRLSDILRRFLENRFGLQAPEMTTEEFLQSLKSRPQFTDPQKTMLEEFLRRCDLVKFAREKPEVSEARKSLELVKNFIENCHCERTK